MLKAIIALIAVLALAAISSEATEARSVNIHERTLEVTTTATSFTISGKASGLAGGFVYEVEVSGAITGTYQCFNGGGNPPPPKSFSTPVAGSGTFVADNNGNVNFSVPVAVPAPSAAGNCSPSGNNWTVQLLSYDGTVNIQICDNPCGVALDSVSNIAVAFP